MLEIAARPVHAAKRTSPCEKPTRHSRSFAGCHVTGFAWSPTSARCGHAKTTIEHVTFISQAFLLLRLGMLGCQDAVPLAAQERRDLVGERLSGLVHEPVACVGGRSGAGRRQALGQQMAILQ